METTIGDTVTMTGLQAGEEYRLHAQVMDTDTGEPLTDKDGEAGDCRKDIYRRDVCDGD